MGNGLISWFWNILGKDDDFELWLVTWWFWVRYFRRSVVDLWKNLGLRLKMMEFQFGPLICENYSLVLELWKITLWSLEKILIFWKELRMNYGQNFSIVMNLWHFQFGPLIWQNYNVTPKNLRKFQISP
jgi:hypothetical protein